MGDLPSWAIELPAVGFLGCCFIILLRWMIGRFSSEMRSFKRAIDRQTVVVLNLQKQLLEHSLSCRASLQGTEHDQLEAVTSRVEEMKRGIDEVRNMITQQSIRESS